MANAQLLNIDTIRGPLNRFEQKNAPKQIYIAGNKDLLSTPSVSIVGSRNASPEGLKRAYQLARDLVKNDVTVVSGLAKGIDTIAHRTAIEENGNTIAVLGTPLDIYYPRENSELQNRIMKDYLAISQFAPGTPTRRENFPQRNRTMALVSHATVIVEASETSGTLLQGWEALRLGRSLFIMKSVIESKQFKWTEEMIRYGASILSDVDDLLSTLPPPPSTIETDTDDDRIAHF